MLFYVAQGLLGNFFIKRTKGDNMFLLIQDNLLIILLMNLMQIDTILKMLQVNTNLQKMLVALTNLI